MAAGTNLNEAARNKQDEWYTRIEDIEVEMHGYRDQFRGKTIYCNCDDPEVSNFYRYFHLNFAALGLKRLVATCYRNDQPDIFSVGEGEHGLLIDRCRAAGRAKTRVLEGDGDFRSPECVALLEQADIVVTNPPFSLFNEFIQQLVEHGKQFIILGTMNKVTNKDIFPLFRDGKVWYGHSLHGQDVYFRVPDHYPDDNAKPWVDDDGNKYRRLGVARWLTNLPHKRRKERLPLWQTYSAKDFPKIDNYDAIEVRKTADIPDDYDGAMAVPISFLDKHCPDQFEIVGMTSTAHHGGYLTKEYGPEDAPNWKYLNTASRPVMRTGKTFKMKFPRILIRKRN